MCSEVNKIGGQRTVKVYFATKAKICLEKTKWRRYRDPALSLQKDNVLLLTFSQVRKCTFGSGAIECTKCP